MYKISVVVKDLDGFSLVVDDARNVLRPDGDHYDDGELIASYDAEGDVVGGSFYDFAIGSIPSARADAWFNKNGDLDPRKPAGPDESPEDDTDTVRKIGDLAGLHPMTDDSQHLHELYERALCNGTLQSELAWVDHYADGDKSTNINLDNVLAILGVSSVSFLLAASKVAEYERERSKQWHDENGDTAF